MAWRIWSIHRTIARFAHLSPSLKTLQQHLTVPVLSEANMAGSYIVAGARTPIGKMSGALSSFSAAELGGFAIKAALERAGVKPEEVEHVIMGQVLMAGQGQVPSRQAAVNAGIPMNVPSVNINKVCLSGLNSIYLADQMIASGEITDAKTIMLLQYAKINLPL